MKNKKNKKIIILILSVIILIVGVVFFLVNNQSIKDEYANTSKVNEIIDYILKNEFDDFDEEKRAYLEEEVEEIVSHETNSEVLSQCNFILGYMNIIDKEYKTSINRLNKAIEYFNKSTDIDIKLRTYYELSRVYIYQQEYTKSEEAYNQGKLIAEDNDRYDLIIEYNLKRSEDVVHIPNGKDEVVEILEETVNIAEEINYDQIEDVYFDLGVAYWYADKSVEAINTKLDALSIAQAKNLKVKICKISTDIGVDYLSEREYDEAVVYLSRVMGYTLDDENEDAKAKSYAYINLCEVYTRLGDFQSAKETFEMLEKSIEKLDDGVYKEDFLTAMYVIRADLESEMDNPSQALKLLEVAEERFNKRDKFTFYYFDVKIAEEYGDAYYKLGNYEKALTYHKQEETLAKEKELAYLEEDYNEKIYMDYKALGEYNNAILYLEKNNTLKTERYNDKNNQYVQYLISKFESDQSAEEITKLQQYKSTMRLILLILLGITIIISVFTYTIYKKNKEINRLNKLFKSLSITDSLTNVQNRRALDEFLAGNWALYKKTHMPISFVMIDIDYFKKYNDNYGHPNGDKALESVASTIKHSCRSLDFVARYGGEEFIIIMLNTDRNEAINIVQRINKNIYNLNIKHEYSQVSDRLTISVGISTAYIGTTNDYEDYIKRADEALYKSKQNGRNTYTFLP